MALVDLSTIPELTLAPEGEYDLRCTVVKKDHSDRTGRNGLMLKHEFVEDDNYQDIFETLWFGNNPKDGDVPAYGKDDEDKSNLMWRMFKERLQAFDVSVEGALELDDVMDDLLQMEFTAYVVVEESDDFPDKNVIKKIT